MSGSDGPPEKDQDNWNLVGGLPYGTAGSASGPGENGPGAIPAPRPRPAQPCLRPSTFADCLPVSVLAQRLNAGSGVSAGIHAAGNKAAAASARLPSGSPGSSWRGGAVRQRDSSRPHRVAIRAGSGREQSVNVDGRALVHRVRAAAGRVHRNPQGSKRLTSNY